MKEEIIKTQVRLPADLTEWMRKQAQQSNRSMNGQFVTIIQEAKAASERQEGRK